MRILIVALLLMLCPARGAEARQPVRYVSAHVYLFGWNTRTRYHLSLDGVRRMSTVTTAIKDGHEATNFARSLELDALATPPKPVVDEPRLVIDLGLPDGTRVTYYANDFYLFSEDGKRMREIDCSFKRRFVLLPPGDCE